MAGGSNPVRAILYAFGANSGIAVAKTAAALYTGSSSMTAEAIHSFADAGNQLLLLLGMRRARLAMRSGLGLDEACRRINDLEVRLRERIPELGWLFMEPDLED